VEYGIHRAMAEPGIETPKGAHVGFLCFRYGAPSWQLASGTPINVVTRHMRHADSRVTLEHYAHIVGDIVRIAFSERIGQNITQSESDTELESTSAVKTRNERTWQKRVRVECNPRRNFKHLRGKWWSKKPHRRQQGTVSVP
jgi:hypothetical protein